MQFSQGVTRNVDTDSGRAWNEGVKQRQRDREMRPPTDNHCAERAVPSVWVASLLKVCPDQSANSTAIEECASPGSLKATGKKPQPRLIRGTDVQEGFYSCHTVGELILYFLNMSGCRAAFIDVSDSNHTNIIQLCRPHFEGTHYTDLHCFHLEVYFEHFAIL